MVAPRGAGARARAVARAATVTDARARGALERVPASRRARGVSFDAELERTIGVADDRVDRGDVWELPRTCDGCGLYILPGCARWSCVVCELRGGDGFDLCAACHDAGVTTTRTTTTMKANDRGKAGARKRKRSEESFVGHRHGASAFELVAGDDDDDEGERVDDA